MTPVYENTFRDLEGEEVTALWEVGIHRTLNLLITLHQTQPKYLLYTVAKKAAVNAITAAVRFNDDILLDPEVDVDSNNDGS